jgi:hypothetical protein
MHMAGLVERNFALPVGKIVADVGSCQLFSAQVEYTRFWPKM